MILLFLLCLMNNNIDGHLYQWLKINRDSLIKNADFFFQFSIHANENSTQEMLDSIKKNKPSIFIRDENNSLKIMDKDKWNNETFKELKKNELSTHVINETEHNNNTITFNKTVDFISIKLPQILNYEKKDSLNNKIICNTTFGICEEIVNYPNDLVKKELSANPTFQYLEVNETHEGPLELSTRFGESIQPLCRSKKQYLRPKAAKNEFGEMLLVVNNNDFVQLIEVEICDDKKTSCDFSENFPAGYASQCQQKFIYRKLLGMDSSKKLGSQIFKIPAGCCCGVWLQDNL